MRRLLAIALVVAALACAYTPAATVAGMRIYRRREVARCAAP
jgi:hypothetical protein